MNANKLIDRAEGLCRALRRPFPAEVKGYAWDWQRRRYDLGWCWYTVQCALRQGRALCNIEAEIHRHHARLQAEKDARDFKAGEPLATTRAPGLEGWWDTHGVLDDLPSPALDDLDGRQRCAEPRQTQRAPRPPYRKRTGTKAHRVRELLRAHAVRRGPIAVLKLERMAKNEGLLQEDQAISQCSTFRRVMKELGIESKRVGFGAGAEYVWRLKPPAWTRGLGVHD